MISKAKHKLHEQKEKIFHKNRVKNLTADEVCDARKYIKDYWEKLTRFMPEDEGSLIGVPNAYLVPSYAEGNEFDYNELFYWDSYFMIQGLLDKKHEKLDIGILEDLEFIFKRYKIIPNSNQTYMTSRSQPPFLTSFIFDLYDTFHLSEEWLEEHIHIAKQEYENVWMGTRKPNARCVYHGLSRYYDFNYLHDIAEAESGWDMTPRFSRKAMNFLPVDLNSLLYKYEMDFSRAATIFKKKGEALDWQTAAQNRKLAMLDLMWDKSEGLFYDYNYDKKKRGNVASLASYYPLWAGLVDGRQAHELVRSLKKFEQKGGLATTDSLPISHVMLPGTMSTQWAYPNGWAPLHFLVVKGLQRYGYHQDARRIAMKWLRCNLDWFNEHGVFLEKYNVVAPSKPPAKGVYPAQSGFGWTNAVFERFCQEFIDGCNPEDKPVI